MRIISPRESWEVFNKLASRYDRTNRILSLGIDKKWRKKVVSFIDPSKPIHLIDLASGTGDLLMAILEKLPNVKKATALDLAQNMLLVAEKKMVSKEFFAKVSFKVGSALDISTPENTFDCATMAFGIRNTGDVEKTLSEIHRVLKPSGQCLILEFSIPKSFFFKTVYLAYFRYVLPLIGGILTRNFSAYYYLNRSVEKIP